MHLERTADSALFLPVRSKHCDWHCGGQGCGVDTNTSVVFQNLLTLIPFSLFNFFIYSTFHHSQMNYSSVI